MLSNQDFKTFIKEGSKKKISQKDEKKKLDKEFEEFERQKIETENSKKQMEEVKIDYRGIDPLLKEKLLKEAR